MQVTKLMVSSCKFDYDSLTLAQLFCSLNFLQDRHCIKDVCPTLKVCWNAFKTTKNFSKQLGIPIINEYGASELDLIAFQSRNTETKGMINAETLFVEILDDKGAVLLWKKAACNHFFIQQSPSVYSLWYWRYWGSRWKNTLQRPILQQLMGQMILLFYPR
jgi:phenylacetate-CoA ligase